MGRLGHNKNVSRSPESRKTKIFFCADGFDGVGISPARSS
jgi:hypothetical protein